MNRCRRHHHHRHHHCRWLNLKYFICEEEMKNNHQKTFLLIKKVSLVYGGCGGLDAFCGEHKRRYLGKPVIDIYTNRSVDPDNSLKRVYLPTYLSTYLPTYQPNYLPTNLPTYHTRIICAHESSVHTILWRKCSDGCPLVNLIKHFMIVIYNSRVVLTRKSPILRL